jgi:hypothetical protein
MGMLPSLGDGSDRAPTHGVRHAVVIGIVMALYASFRTSQGPTNTNPPDQTRVGPIRSIMSTGADGAALPALPSHLD